MSLKRKGTGKGGQALRAVRNLSPATPRGDPIETTDNNTPTWATASLKRQRVSRACDQCRAAREKCDGIQPLCYPCVSQNRACTYEASPKKRGVQVGYIRTLELALAWLFDEVQGCEDALADGLTNEGLFAAGRDGDRANQLHKKWRKSKVRRQIDSILAGSSTANQLPGKTSPESDSDPESGKSTDGTGQGDGGAYSDAGTADDVLYKSQTNKATASTTAGPTILRLPANHWRLLDIYFSYTHCWFPILDKQEVLKTVYLYGADGVKLSSLESTASHAELWSVLALASCQEAAGASSAEQPELDRPPWTPQKLYQVARELIPTENGPFQSRHATALLLLSLVNLGRGNSTAAWSFLGKARDIALDAGHAGDGHRNQRHPSRQTERITAAVITGCSILETLVSIVRKRPFTGSLTLYDTIHTPLSEDELDEWQPWVSCPGFGAGAASGGQCRTPAHSLSTFNQLYDLFHLLRKPRQQYFDAEEKAAKAMTPEMLERQQTPQANAIRNIIRPGLPFGRFVLDKTGSAETPSAHVLRLLCTWAEIQLCLSENAAPGRESNVSSLILSLLDSLQQYITLFGTSGIPPLLIPCMVYVRIHADLQRLPADDQRRWQTVERRVAAVWNFSDVYYGQQNSPLSSASMTSPLSIPTSAFLSSPSLNRHSVPILPSIAQGGYFGVETAEWGQRELVENLRHRTLPGSADTNPPRHPGSYATGGHAGAHMHAARGADLPVPQHQHQHQQHQQHHQHQHQHQHRHSYSSVALDYDALLGDLTSMDYTDRADTNLQPQFMANLGFAPGCDISESLMQDFDSVVLP